MRPASSAVRCSKQACCARVDLDAGELNEASGRWPVEVDAVGVNGAAVRFQIRVRAVNLVEREVSGGRMSFCNAPLPPRASIGAHCARTEALFMVADYHKFGCGVCKDNAAAIRWYRCAAAAGRTAAARELQLVGA